MRKLLFIIPLLIATLAFAQPSHVSIISITSDDTVVWNPWYVGFPGTDVTDPGDGGVLVTITSGAGSGDLLADGTIPLTANWDIGSFKIIAGADDVSLKPATTVTMAIPDSRGQELADQLGDETDDDIQIAAAHAIISGGDATNPTSIGRFGKGKLTLMEGKYSIGDTLNPTAGSIWQGLGPGTWLNAKSGLDKPMLCIDEDTDNPNAGYMIEDVWFDGNRTGGTQTNTSGIDTQCGTYAGWDTWSFRNFLFSFATTVIQRDDPWGGRDILNVIEDSDAKAIDVTVGSTKTTGYIAALNKIIQNGTAITLNAGLQGNIVGLNELNADKAGGYALDLLGADYNLGIGNSTFGAGSLGNTTHGVHMDSTADYNAIIGWSVAGIKGTAFDVDSGARGNKFIGTHCDNTATGGGCIVDQGTETWVWAATSHDDVITQQVPSPVTFNTGFNSYDYGFNGTSVPSLLLVRGSADEVRIGDTDGGNYVTIEGDGDLKIAGNSKFLVPNNGYAFAADTAPLAGVVLGNSLWQLKNVSGTTTASINIDGTITSTTTVTSDDVVATGDLNVTPLISCDTVDTDVNGRFSCGTDAGAAGGDSVTVNSTAVDTTANFLDGDIDWTLADGGGGGPDDITGTVECTDCVSKGDAADDITADVKCIVIETPADADDILFFRADAAMTVTSMDCIVEDATSVVMVLVECDSAGDNCGSSRFTESVICDVDGQADNGLTETGIVAGAWMRAQVGTVTGSTHVAACLSFTYDD